MLDYNDLVLSIKKAAMDAVGASKQTGVVFGTVVGTDPIGIQIDHKLILGAGQLILTRNVTNHECPITLHTQTQPAADNRLHLHMIEGTSSIVMDNQLLMGEKVVMIQMLGGQKFIVLDRVV